MTPRRSQDADARAVAWLDPKGTLCARCARLRYGTLEGHWGTTPDGPLRRLLLAKGSKHPVVGLTAQDLATYRRRLTCSWCGQDLS